MATHRLRLNQTRLRPGEMVVNGKSLYKDKIIVSTQPETKMWERNVDIYTFKARHGFLAIDNKTRKSDTLSLEIGVVANSALEFEGKRNYLQSLADGQLHEFQFYHDPYGYYVGLVKSIELQGKRGLGFNRKGKMELELQPYRYVGGQSIDLSNGDRIEFDYGFLMPVFRIMGSGSIDLNTDNHVPLKGVPSGTEIIIDSINKATYQQRGGVRIPRGDLKANYAYPTISSGTQIRWTGNVDRVILEPNWVL